MSSDIEGGAALNQTDLAIIPTLVTDLTSEQDNVVLKSLTQLREMLSTHENPLISQIVDAGAIPQLTKLLLSSQPLVLEQAVISIAIITSGASEHNKVLVDCGVVELLVGLLHDQTTKIYENVTLSLSNIATESAGYSNLILSTDIIPRLIVIMNNKTFTVRLMRTITMLLSNLSRFRYSTQMYHSLSPMLSTLTRLIFFSDQEVITNVATVFYHLSRGGENKIDRINELIGLGIIPQLIRILSAPNHTITLQFPILRFIGNLIMGSDLQTQTLLDLGILPPLIQVLTTTQSNPARCEIVFILSNIAAGTTGQILQLINAGIFPVLLDIAKGSNTRITCEIAWTFSNATSSQDASVIEYIGTMTYLRELISLLSLGVNELVNPLIQTFDHFLQFGKNNPITDDNNNKINPYIDMLRDLNAEDVFLSVKMELSSQISLTTRSKIIEILKDFFDIDDDGD